MQPLSKNEILRGFNRGDEKARNAVYDHYHDAILVLVKRMTNNSSYAEDLVNDVFRAFFEKSRNFDELSDLRNWLFQTGKNICINYSKKQQREQEKHDGFKQLSKYTDEDFYADIAYSETRALIFKSIEALPDKLKIVFRLRFFEDLSNDVVAERLNIAEKTVYNRYSEARQKLKWDLEKIQRFTIYLLNLLL